MTRIVLLEQSHEETDETREYTDITAQLAEDGSVRFLRVDMGPQIETDWDDYDLEVWFDVSPQDAARALALARRIFANPEPSAWSDLIAGLEADGIPVSLEVWR